MSANKTITLVFFILTLLSCKNRLDQITVKVKVIDEYSKQPRVKDTVQVRMGKWGIPMKRYIKVSQHITDSLGVVKINLNRNKTYRFSTNAIGYIEFAESELKDSQQIILEVTSQAAAPAAARSPSRGK
jgi:hypothetical protein